MISYLAKTMSYAQLEIAITITTIICVVCCVGTIICCTILLFRADEE